MTYDLVLIACSASKRTRELPAAELYSSAHFDYQLEKAELIARELGGADVGIVSALHGIVDLDTWLKPYDQRLGNSGSIAWHEVADQLRDRGARRVLCLLPKAYRELVENAGQVAGVDVVDGFVGCRGIGAQRGRLAQLADDVTELEAAEVELDRYPTAPIPPAYVAPVKLDHQARQHQAANLVGELGEQLADTRYQLELALRAAVDAGVPERQLAELSGLARGTVRAIVGRSVSR
jgi:hypothetical protein